MKTAAALRLDAVGESAWLIRDPARAASDPRAVVGRIEQGEHDVEVVWLQPTPLPTRYLSPEDALEDVTRLRAIRPAHRRPIPIPTFPPPRRLRGELA